MGDLCSAEELPAFTYVVQADIVRKTSCCFSESYDFDAVMDDYLIKLINFSSHLSRRLIRFVEDLVFRYVARHSQVFDVSFSGCYGRQSHKIYESCSTDFSMFSKVSCAKTGILDHSGVFASQRQTLSVIKVSGIIGIGYVRRFVHQGFMFSLYTLKEGIKLVSACWRSLCAYCKYVLVEVEGFLLRAKKTLQGSSLDIGWLQSTEGLPPVEDGTSRFMELLHDIRNGEHCLPNTLIYLLIPGLFSNHSPLYFVNTKRFFSKMGLACHIAKIHSEASVEKNAWELKQYIEELYWGSGKCVLLLGHSKGGVDAAAALSMYWTDLKDKVAGLALVQSPYAGSPIASDILREGQLADKEARRIMEFIICKLIKGDMRALDDLTYEKRKDFIAKHWLPADQVPLVSFHTEASMAPGVLATMSQIAHAELPWLPLPRICSEAETESGRKVPVVIPLAAAMAVSAFHLWLRYGEKSDGLVTRCDAEVPGSVVVRPDRKLDHSWMVCSSLKKDKSEADASEICEALLTMLVEIGRTKQALVS